MTARPSRLSERPRSVCLAIIRPKTVSWSCDWNKNPPNRKQLMILVMEWCFGWCLGVFLMHKQMSAWHASGLLCFLCSHLQTNKRRTNEVLMWFGVLLLIKAMPQTWCLCRKHRTECKRCGLYRRVKVTQDGGWKHKATCCQHLFHIHYCIPKIVIIFICMIRSSHVSWIKCISYCPGAVVREYVCVCTSFESYFHIRCSLFISVET